MENNSKKILTFTTIVALIGLYSGLIAIANFHCHKTFYGDYFNTSKKDSLVKQKNPDTSTMRTVVNTTTSNSITDTLNKKENILRTEENISTKKTQKDTVDYELFDISPRSNNQANSDDEINVQMSEPPPSKGLGKLVLRSYCNHCSGTYANLRILLEDSTENENSSIVANYDSLNKRYSTFVKDLLPGKYLIELNYHLLGKDFFNINIIEGKTALYRFKKINPYGENNSQIVFFSKNATRKWNITIDKRPEQTITIYKNKGTSIIVSSGWHEYKIGNPEQNDLDLNSEKLSLYLQKGERKAIYID
ncbi:hypothetical protein A4D02_35390 [Niastella koreensis]|uniref:Uncharacterized protein n=2 Tax=Niastella koreensis TaxID=354356 RepID=G8TJH4_NIAKG|nr:hypothetical protein [Niastella koreensis]AEV99709.1 hypothetical protein Niako_3403 [Niastella koreensis GR20-10]OQP44266.1 hypothetical protein A4D02_35390 [Niastella koreensis]